MNQNDVHLKEDSEMIVIVNKNNEIIGEMTRNQMRKEKQCHRATFVFVIQKGSNKIFCHKRTKTKRYCPSYYDACFGGVVGVNETYESCALRELQEESGLLNLELHPVGDFYYGGDDVSVWGRIFYTFFDGLVVNLQPQPEEVEFIELMSIKEIQKRVETGELFTPDGNQALHILFEYLEKNSII